MYYLDTCKLLTEAELPSERRVVNSLLRAHHG